MSKFRIPVPGDLNSEFFGKNYYATDKHGNLAIIGEDARPNILRRYNFWFTEELAKSHGLEKLPNEMEVVE